MHNLTMVVYIQYHFHELPSIGYLVMAEDGKTDGQHQNNIPPPLAQDNNTRNVLQQVQISNFSCYCCTLLTFLKKF